MSFADQMIVIKDHQILAQGTPSDLYQHPKEHYVAALFDDVNDLLIDGKRRLIYPHQILVVENSNYKATVKRSYYKGFYWLIEADFEGQTIFFQSNTTLENEAIVSFVIKN